MMNTATWQIVLAGTGGQGLGLAGQILAETALTDGLHATHNQSYGARARGGYSQSSVVISTQEVSFPFVEEPCLVIALSQKAYDLFLPLLAPGGLLLYDNGLVHASGQHRESSPVVASAIGLAFGEVARQAGNQVGIAMVSLGSAVELTGLVTTSGMHGVLAQHFQGPTLDLNRRYLTLGHQLASTTVQPPVE